MATEKLVIVGSGPAGLTAALYAARAALEPLVIEGLQPGGQLTTTTEVENYPGAPEAFDGTALVTRMREQAERFGARYRLDEITAADFAERPLRLTLSGGATLAAHAVILATGASARYLGLPSEQRFIGKGVSGCATCDGAFYRGREVAVVGGGDTAMEEALFLARLCSKVTVIHRRDAFRASKIMADRVTAHAGIAVAWNSVVDAVLGDERQGVTGVRLKHVGSGALTDLAVAGLFVAIGHTPNTGAFRGQLALDDDGYIAVDGARTSVEGVFAAGDVHDRVYRQAVTAAGAGCRAALEAERYLQTRDV